MGLPGVDLKKCNGFGLQCRDALVAPMDSLGAAGILLLVLVFIWCVFDHAVS